MDTFQINADNQIDYVKLEIFFEEARKVIMENFTILNKDSVVEKMTMKDILAQITSV